MTKFWRAGALLALCAATALAVDWKLLQPQGYVSDFAGVVDAASKAQLEQYCARVEKATGAQIALVTIPSLEGEPIEDVANTIFRSWGIGKKGQDNGVMLLLAVGDRRSRLEVGYGLEPYLPDGFDGSVLREMRPALRQSHYGEAAMAAAQTIGSRIAESKGVALDAPLPRRVHPQTRDSVPFPILLFGGLLLMWMLGGGRRGGFGGGLLSGLILGNMMGRSSWGGRGSGGFGGFDSGDSFGGFGGGDSGGGGASSDW